MLDHQIPKPILNAVNDLIQAIDNDPLNRKSISMLYPHYYSNRNIIYPAFKAVTGLPIDEYRAFRLMEAAAKMVDERELTIRQIAYKCGYKGKKASSNFSRAFKKVWEITPKEWQQGKKGAEPPQLFKTSNDSKNG